MFLYVRQKAGVGGGGGGDISFSNVCEHTYIATLNRDDLITHFKRPYYP